MNRFFKTITACVLMLVMTAISPMTDLSQGISGSAKAAETDGQENQLYISEIKIGNAYTNGDGPSLEETVSQLEGEGYTILKDGADYADLNAGNKPSSVKKGPTEKIIILGYKTTTNPDEAITDLAVMNMNGGYSVDDYNKLLETQMESQIKPFMNNFISALEEYRENLKKPKDSSNYIRADFMRQLLNKITDDDTGDKPLGDLLRNKTKYELGDAAYNKLSSEEKKDHADIITILMQGNQTVVMELENFIARAADTGKNTWIERMQHTTTADLRRELLEEKPGLSKQALNAELDKKYQDDAKRFLNKWTELSEALRDVDTAQDTVDNYDGVNLDNAIDEVNALSENADTEEAVDAFGNLIEQQSEAAETLDAGTTVAVSEFLDDADYDFKVGKESGSTLLEFFSQDASAFTGDGIRELYPLVDSLSAGQLAGLDLISARDLVAIGMNDTTGYQEIDISEMTSVSVFDGINREIYKPGGVALTSDALRKQARIAEEIRDPSIGHWATWALGASSVVMLVATVVVRKILSSQTVTKAITQVEKATVFRNGVETAEEMTWTVYEKTQKFSQTAINTVTVILSAVTLALVVATIVFTVTDLQSQYDVNFVAIPNYMVDEIDIVAYNEKGEKILLQNQSAYYRPATCTRIEGKSDTEKKNYKVLADRADLNGDIGQQWLALYYVKNENAEPILADSLLYQKGGGSVPSGYSTGIHEFGGRTAVDLNKRAYLFTKDAPMIRVYYKNATPATNTTVDVTGDKDAGSATDADAGSGTDSGSTSGTTGSIFSEGSEGTDGSGSGITAIGLALGGGIGIILGGLLMVLIMYLSRRKKVTIEKK